MNKLIKYAATILFHPFVFAKLIAKGARDFVILPRMTINSVSGLHLDKNVHIGRDSRFLLVKAYKGADYDPMVRIGSNVTIGNRFSALSAAPITIGDDALIASDVLITSENHGMDPETHFSYADNPLSAAPVSIGRGVWIGEKACILPGVTLGDKCIVAAGAVVTHSFPAYTILAGVPAKAIKRYNLQSHEWENV